MGKCAHGSDVSMIKLNELHPHQRPPNLFEAVFFFTTATTGSIKMGLVLIFSRQIKIRLLTSGLDDGGISLPAADAVARAVAEAGTCKKGRFRKLRQAAKIETLVFQIFTQRL